MDSYKKLSFSDLNSRISTDLAAMPAVLAEPLSAMWSRACSSQHGFLSPPDILIAQTGGGTGLFNSSVWTPDMTMHITSTITTLPTITGGTSAKIGWSKMDIHQQVRDFSGTINKDLTSSGNFWI